ncbi:MAG TPA: ATP-binding protein [Oscillatoriaceae cyanobacterium]
MSLPRRPANTGQLVQSERLHTLGQLVAGVIHEMNNPLTIVNTNLQVLAEYVQQQQHLIGLYEQLQCSTAEIAGYREEIDWPYLSQDLGRILASVQEGATRALNLVDELRRYSASNSPEIGPIDLRDRLVSTVRLVESTYRNRINFVLDIERLPPIMGVAGQIQQVFMNLLINACQAIPNRGEVRISSDADADQVTLRISDTGTGIEADVLPRIFEPYFSTKSAADGTGLGLPITKRIVEKHGGRLEVESAPEVGTTFTIVLPIEGVIDMDADGMPYEL